LHHRLSANFSDPEQGTIVIGGMLEHIEFAGVHSGDAAMVLPPHTLTRRPSRPSANTPTRWRAS
jgi:hypothetical protein